MRKSLRWTWVLFLMAMSKLMVLVVLSVLMWGCCGCHSSRR